MIAQETILLTKDGVRDEDFMHVLKELANEYISKQEGFINRFYFKHDEGKWIIYIFFETNEAADNSFMNFQKWEKSDNLLSRIKVNGLIIHKHDMPVDLQKMEKKYSSIIAQEIIVPLRETTTDERMIEIFNMLTEDYFSKYPGYLNRFFVKYDETHFILYVFFDNNEHAVGCIADFRAWEKAKILIDAIYEDKLNFKHYEINDPLL